MSKIEVNTVEPQCGTTLTVGKCNTSVNVPGSATVTGNATAANLIASGNVVKTNAVQASDAGNIISQSGTTITLGASGDTVTLASGASQSGFGRAGSVNWQTSIKTATFTAASGEGYFCNTSGGAFTVNLPSSPSVGDIVAIKDYGSSFDTENLTIGRGGSNMNGTATDSTRTVVNESLTMVYADATKGWLAVEEGSGFIGESYIQATGGTITNTPTCRIHTFTGPGTFTVCATGSTAANNIVSYLVVAGGGTGGERNSNNYYGGGGGAGGFRELKNPVTPYTASPLDGYPTPGNRITVTAQGYPITVGAGGAKGSGSGNCGSNSTFSTITSAGGGHGGWALSPTNKIEAEPGGSGGGYPGWYPGSAGSGNDPSTTPAQGQDGNKPSAPSPAVSAGGGGGATQAGQAAPNNLVGGAGGAGATTGISGSNTAYAGGGGGAAWQAGYSGGAGGTGGGGQGSNGGPPPANGTPGVDGTANTGGGGGGGGADFVPTSGGNGGAASGGSGVVIIRYKFQ